MIQAIEKFIFEIKVSWQYEFEKPKFKVTALLTVIALIPLVTYLNTYLEFIEQRPGCNLDDFLLDWLPVWDVSNAIFIILYTSSAFIVLYCLKKPWLFLRAVQTFILLQYIRNICLYFTPLSAPYEIIPLQDPLLTSIAYNNKPNLQDLFFSGHTATMVIFVLLTWNRPGLRLIFAIIAIIMAFLLMVQHCHYTVDIFGGIVFAYLSYNWIRWFWVKLQLPLG